MKKLNFFIILLLLINLSCTKQVEKPKVTLGQFSEQTIVTRGMVNKILSQDDYKKTHELAYVVESNWMVNCFSVGEECNLYNQILNKIINATHAGPISDSDNIAIHKMINEMEQAQKSSQLILTEQWKEYLLAHPTEANSIK